MSGQTTLDLGVIDVRKCPATAPKMKLLPGQVVQVTRGIPVWLSKANFLGDITDWMLVTLTYSSEHHQGQLRELQ